MPTSPPSVASAERQRPPAGEQQFRLTPIPIADPSARASASEDGSPLRVAVSLSSETPVPRWFGLEVLRHTPDAVDLSRATERGLPLLWNHSPDLPVGRLEEVRLDANRRRLVATLRLGRSPRALEIARDIEDGVLTDLSIGYRVDAWAEPESSEDGVDRYVATRWTLLEGSIVAVPADVTIGIGRATSSVPTAMPNVSREESPSMSDHESTQPAAAPPAAAAPPVSASAGIPREQEARWLATLAEHFDVRDRLPVWLREGYTVERARQDIEDTRLQRSQAQTPTGYVDLSAREAKQYNICRAIMAVADGTWTREGSLEREVSEAAARSMRKDPRGFFLPLNVGVRSITGQVVGTSSLGGAAVQTTIVSLIELLRNRTVVQRAGARVLTGLTDTIAFPRQITSNSFTMTGENPSLNATTAATFDLLTLSPKTAMISTAHSRQFLIQSSIDASNFVLDDLSQVAAIGIDNMALNGTGSSNQPTGVRSTSGIGNRTLGANGAQLAWADIIGFETDISVANAPENRRAYVTNARVRGRLKQTLQNTVSGALWIWQGGNDPGEVAGYPAYVSNLMPSNLTQGTSTTVCSSIVFGDWSELLIGMWGGALDVIVDPYTQKNRNMIEVTGIALFDVGVRHAASFSKSDAVLTP